MSTQMDLPEWGQKGHRGTIYFNFWFNISISDLYQEDEIVTVNKLW